MAQMEKMMQQQKCRPTGLDGNAAAVHAKSAAAETERTEQNASLISKWR